MAKKKKQEKEVDVEDRVRDLSDDSGIKDELPKVYKDVVKGFEDKTEQNIIIERCWDVYNCMLNDNQAYSGESQIYIPLVHDAIEARVTRFSNTLFPQNSHSIEIVSDNKTPVFDLIALLDHYVSSTELRETVTPALLRVGDVTGQYSLYVDWNKVVRHVVVRERRTAVQTETGSDIDGAEEIDDVKHEKIVDESPGIMVLDPRDIVILPATVDRIEDADTIAVAMRWSEEKIQREIDAGNINENNGKKLIAEMSSGDRNSQPETQKKAASAAGVKLDSKSSKLALVYQVWKKLKIKGKLRWCVTHFAGEDNILACRRNPYWNDRVPVLSQPAMKQAGTIWGKSRVEPVEKIQYAANDAVNMGFDSAQYSLLPIVMTDPEKNPRVGSMVMAMAALWETNPNDTKFAEFPQLWKDAFQMVVMCRDQILTSLGVNPAMLPHGNTGKKPTQAQVAQEQQIALESTANEVTIIETGIFSPLLRWFYELDYQYRDRKITLKKYGELGVQAEMQEIEPIQVGNSFQFRWFGSEGFKSAQQVQQQIAGMNVLRGIPPEQLNGRKIDIGPILEQVVGNVYGPRLAPKILIDQRHMLSASPDEENYLLRSNFPVDVQPMDNDVEHIRSHYKEMARSGDPAGFFRVHILKHMEAAAAKNKAMAGQKLGGTPGTPSPPGVAGIPGQPRVGAQPGQPRPVQNPPGVVNQDQMSDPNRMPR